MNKVKRKALKRARQREVERLKRHVVVGVRQRRFGYWQEETDILLAEKRRKTNGKQKKPSPGYFINEYGFEQPIDTRYRPRPPQESEPLF